jgi:leucyl-tRNA synthetase
MYLGPVDQSKTWDTQAIVGVHRFLQRVWRNFVDDRTGELRVVDEPADDEAKKLLHRTLHAVTENMDDIRFNTAIARIIEFNNAWVGRDRIPREIAEPLVLMIAPMAPHLCEELWERLGHGESLAQARWPAVEERYLVREEIEIVVQVMGKKRGTVTIAADADEAAVEAAALAHDGVKRHIEGKTVRKVVHVPGRLVNIVAN